MNQEQDFHEVLEEAIQDMFDRIVAVDAQKLMEFRWEDISLVDLVQAHHRAEDAVRGLEALQEFLRRGGS